MDEKIVGQWKQDYVDNFDAFMKKLGVSFLLRTAGAQAITHLTFTKDGEDWSLSYKIAFKSGVLKFKSGQEIDEVTPDGRKVKTTFTKEDESVVQVQKGQPYNVTIKRCVEEDGKLHEISTIDGTELTCKRTYLRQ